MQNAIVPVSSFVDRALFPFTDHFHDVGEGRLHYVDEGSGPVFLFVHGTPTWSLDWRHAITALRPTHRCVAPTHLGFGLSDRPADASYTPQAHAERLRRFVEALDLRDLTLVVHDFGGPIGLPLALFGDRVRRVVLLNTFFWPAEGSTAFAARLLHGRFGRWLYRHLHFSVRVLARTAVGDPKQLDPRVYRMWLAPFPDPDSRELVLHALARALLDSRDHYARLYAARERLHRLPVLVIWGERDPAFPPAVLARVEAALPRATVIRLPTGHFPQEEAPEAFTSALRDWDRSTVLCQSHPSDLRGTGFGSSAQ